MARLTAAREQQMLDACTATRPAAGGQTPELDPDTGMPGEATAPTVYSGPCTISDPGQLGPGQGTVDDQSAVPSVRVLQTPHRADLHPGDLVRIDTPAFSPGLVGDECVVLGEDERSYATERRYRVRGSSWLSPEAPA